MSGPLPKEFPNTPDFALPFPSTPLLTGGAAFYLIINLSAGGTSGWFPDGVGDKPWYDTSSSESPTCSYLGRTYFSDPFVLQPRSTSSHWHKTPGRAHGPAMSTSVHSACKLPYHSPATNGSNGSTICDSHLTPSPPVTPLRCGNSGGARASVHLRTCHLVAAFLLPLDYPSVYVPRFRPPGVCLSNLIGERTILLFPRYTHHSLSSTLICPISTTLDPDYSAAPGRTPFSSPCNSLSARDVLVRCTR